MIKTNRQLKDLIRKQSKGDNLLSRSMLQYYFMERLLERISLSYYRDNFILKGGMLVTALVGTTIRSTNDIDLTIRNIVMNEGELNLIFKEIIALDIEDNIELKINSITKIMDDNEYGGFRMSMEGRLENMIVPFKVDLSAGDKITPSAIQYSYDFMLENKSIRIWSYNIETLLAEKMETVISRGIANTRMRDYYDVYVLSENYWMNIDFEKLKEAYTNTSKYRGTIKTKAEIDKILEEVEVDSGLNRLWNAYSRKFKYAESITWEKVMFKVLELFERVGRS